MAAGKKKGTRRPARRAETPERGDGRAPRRAAMQTTEHRVGRPPRAAKKDGAWTPEAGERRSAKSRRDRAMPTPRTASGKKANPATLEEAQRESREFLRERTEEGHLAAGRTPPSQTPVRRAGAT